MTRDPCLQGLCALALATIMISPAGSAQNPPPLSLMPLPASAQMETGSLRVDSSFSTALSGYAEPRLNRAVERFLRQLARQTAIPISSKLGDASKATFVIHTDHASKQIQELGEDESYLLEVSANGAKLSAQTPLGSLHGLQTFLQLVDVSPDGFAAPAVIINDKPRFPWRGLMIDSARHFMPLEVLHRNIDGMEAVKMNVFHWHLSENQGFRIESKKFPKLHEKGSDGLYYTQDEVRELIAYARDRGIRVVPEFDVPGHSTAWFVGHPEFASGPGPYEIERMWGVVDPAFDPTNEKTYKFLDNFIGEMARLFPDHFFHIGGDEVNGKQWAANPKIVEFMKAHGLPDSRALQAYFNKRLEPIVSKHGKSMIGWDEILDQSLPKDITIQSWRGQESLADAAKKGYRGILSNGYYLDLGWSAARHYAVDPMSGAAANLSSEEKQRILGGESCMWSEYVNPENVDSRIWPRNAAIAERLWSPQEVTDPASMYERMEAESARLEWLGPTHRSYSEKMLQRIAGSTATPAEFAALRIFAEAVEPVKDYTRGRTAAVPATSATPLNRVLDAVFPESNAARRFGELVDRFLATSCSDSAIQMQIRSQLTIWAGNDALLTPLGDRSVLVKEISVASKALSDDAAAGLRALDAIRDKLAAAENAKNAELNAIKVMDEQAANAAQLVIAPSTAIQKLVEAVGTAGGCLHTPAM